MISEEKINYLIADEKKAWIDYTKLGFTNLAKDEKKHYNFLKRLRKQKYGY